MSALGPNNGGRVKKRNKSDGSASEDPLNYLNWYIDAGKRVVGLNGKIPVETGWQRMPFRYPNDIPTGLWKRNKYNFGWVLDDVDLVVDIDRHSNGVNGWDSYNRLIDDLCIKRLDEMTPANVLTGGRGSHIYLSKPANVAIRTKHPRYPGIDFLTKGKQVVAAGAIHPITGRAYKFIRDFDSQKMARLPEAPDELLELLSGEALDESIIALRPSEKGSEYRRVCAALSHIDPDLDYPDWINILFALHSMRGDKTYRVLADTWSALGGKYETTGANSVKSKWATFDRDPMRSRTITIGTLFKMAKDCGWDGREDNLGPYYWQDGGTPETSNAIRPQRIGPVSITKILAMPFKPLRFVVEDLIPDVGVMILSSAPKVGKTTLAHQMCLALMLEVPFLGQVHSKPRRILFLALEDSPRRIKRRTNDILDAPEFDLRESDEALEGLMIETEWDAAPEGINKLNDWLEKNPDTDLVVIDTLAAFRGLGSTTGNNVYQQDYELMKKIKSVADQHETSILILHHNRKAQADSPIESIGGSYGLTGAADGYMVMSAQGFADAEFLLISQSRETGPQELALKREDFAFKLLGDASRFMMSEERREVLELLEQVGDGIGPLEIANTLGRSASSTRKLLTTMHRRGIIKRLKRGVYVPSNSGNSGNFDNAQNTGNYDSQ